VRRRIDTFQSVSDATILPYLYLNRLNGYFGEVELDEPPLALYDEMLWAELEQAQAALRSVEARIAAAAVREPLDQVEVALGLELYDMLRGAYNAARCTEIEDQLRAHAATVERK